MDIHDGPPLSLRNPGPRLYQTIGSYFVRTGEWVRIEAANYGPFSRLVFIRAGP